MSDLNYKKALCEVDDILENTDKSLIDMIPISFLKWIKDNKLKDYKTLIKNDIPIEKQELQLETEAIISLIFRKYWSTDEEKREFAEKDKEEYLTEEELKRQQYTVDLKEMLKNTRKKEVTEMEQESNALIEVKKEEGIFRKIINKIKSLFKNKI